MRRSRPLIALAVTASLVLAACGEDDDNATPATEAPVASEAPAETEAPAAELVDIVDTAVAAGSFTTLAQLLTDAGLVETLKGEGPFTVFAPTDEAFAKVPAETLEALAADPELLTTVLTYHVVAGSVPSSAVTPGMVPTVAGPEIEITVDGSTVMVNDATVTAVDVMASNGVIHVIDTVLLPPDMAAAPAAEEDMGGEMASDLVDIVDTAVAAGNFTTLAQLLTDAGLVDVLKGEGPFTVFAPTDEAFAKVPAETLEALAADPELLTTVLTYHVVAGAVPSSEVQPGMVPTVAGPELTISVDGSTVMVNDATVTAVDVMASNGVIHVIDSVLLPPQ